MPLRIERARGETQLFVKEVIAGGVRYIVCRNEAEAEKDRADRLAIVDGLQRRLKQGEKALIANTGYTGATCAARARARPSRSTPASSPRKPATTVSSCSGPTPASPRSTRCSATASCSCWSRCSGRRRQPSKPARSSIPAMPRSAATSSARSSRSSLLRNSRGAAPGRASSLNGRGWCAISTGCKARRHREGQQAHHGPHAGHGRRRAGLSRGRCRPAAQCRRNPHDLISLRRHFRPVVLRTTGALISVCNHEYFLKPVLKLGLTGPTGAGLKYAPPTQHLFIDILVLPVYEKVVHAIPPCAFAPVYSGYDYAKRFSTP